MALLKVILCIFSLSLSLMVTDASAANKVNKSSNNSIKSAVNKFFPRDNVNFHYIGKSLILTGEVSSADNAAKIEKLVKKMVNNPNNVLNFMQITTGQQVMLRVRVGEVKKDFVNMGFYNKDFSNLVERGMVAILAEPNLIAMSGEVAEFLAGGEIPLPVNDNDSITYKSYGVKLKFSPLVISPNRIKINLEQEVSDISNKYAMKMRGTKLPSINSRKASTTVELAPGESFMVAGMLKDEHIRNGKKSTELVISVTPYLVDPIAAKDIKLPTDMLYTPTQIERKFMQNLDSGLNSGSKIDNMIQLVGPVGYITE